MSILVTVWQVYQLATTCSTDYLHGFWSKHTDVTIVEQCLKVKTELITTLLQAKKSKAAKKCQNQDSVNCGLGRRET